LDYRKDGGQGETVTQNEKGIQLSDQQDAATTRRADICAMDDHCRELGVGVDAGMQDARPSGFLSRGL
jgi:hypothetical protein